MTGDELAKLLGPTIERLGYELSDLEAQLGGRGGVVRIFIDHPDGINLEVSSPGLDRKLTKVEHFQRFAGEIVKVQMRFPIGGRKRFRGTLVSSDDENIVVEVDGESHSLPMATIDTARLVPAGT